MIRTERLTKIYDGGGRHPVVAVDALDLEVHSGEVFGLLGPNGAGKTTTLGMLTTRIVPTSGKAWVGGIDVVRDPVRTKQVIGVMPQTNTLDRSLTVRENLEFHGRYFGMRRKDARAEALRLLERFRLSERPDAPVATLSGGMAQRLMLARAVMHRPRVVFLDEPTAGLDPQSRRMLWELVRELHEQGQTLLLTTHYMEEADLLCGRVAIMDHGRILALDTPEALKRQAGAETSVVVQANGDRKKLARALAALPESLRTLVTGEGVRVYTRNGGGILPRVLAAASQAGFHVRDLRLEAPTLETVFIKLTGKELRE